MLATLAFLHVRISDANHGLFDEYLVSGDSRVEGGGDELIRRKHLITGCIVTMHRSQFVHEQGEKWIYDGQRMWQLSKS